MHDIQYTAVVYYVLDVCNELLVAFSSDALLYLVIFVITRAIADIIEFKLCDVELESQYQVTQ